MSIDTPVPTTREDIKNWKEEGIRRGATHLIVVCDTFDWEDYPTYVMPGENMQEKYDHYHGPNMQKVMEVFEFKADPKTHKVVAKSIRYNGI
jgi:hypothetical protein